MKTFLLLAVALVAFASAASPSPKEQARLNTITKDVFLDMMITDHSVKCKICISYFRVLKYYIGDVTKLTMEGLVKIVKLACWLPVPIWSEVCEIIILFLDQLYQLIVYEEKAINPESCCQLIHFCPTPTTTTGTTAPTAPSDPTDATESTESTSPAPYVTSAQSIISNY